MTSTRTILAKFAGTCSTCKRPFPQGAIIHWAPGAGATHETPADCARAEATAAPPRTLDGAPIAAFLAAAQARGLKFPKARFLAPDGRSEMRLSVAGARSNAPGAINVVINRDYIGRILPDGTVTRGLTAPVLACLETIAAAPAIAAKSYAAVTSRCSFCNLALTDAGSVEVGYGPICAERYGLPHTAKGTPVLTRAALETVPAESAPDWTDDDRDAADEALAARRREDVAAGRIARHWDDDALPF